MSQKYSKLFKVNIYSKGFWQHDSTSSYIFLSLQQNREILILNSVLKHFSFDRKTQQKLRVHNGTFSKDMDMIHKRNGIGGIIKHVIWQYA